MGRKTTTVTGKNCQHWNSQYPHTHTMTSSMFPDACLTEAANFCRNPDGRAGGPWCYTVDSNFVWESCGIPMCGTTFSNFYDNDRNNSSN